MQFVIIAYDGENALEKRMEVRQQHIDNIDKIDGKLVCGGGLLDEEGKMKGSVMVMEFDSREKFDKYLQTEPYYVNHVWEKVQVENMNVVFLDGDKVGK